MSKPTHLALAGTLAQLFAALPQVQAVALGGSSAGTHADAESDIDIYIYQTAPIPLAERERILQASGGATRPNLGLDYWGPGDEWYHAPSGIEVDVTYFDAGWMEEQLRRVLLRHQAQNGYSTCFWHTIKHSVTLYDRAGWFAELQRSANVPYPPQLAKAIIQHNHPTLRGIIPSYQAQILKALARNDLPSINHRLAALLAGYFDILFAANYQTHPGEKRMLQHLLASGATLPQAAEHDLQCLLLLDEASLPDLPSLLTALLDHLDAYLREHGMLPA